ncbi:GNAT family N-acetyltransferase [Candidatus Woesearchaeota archaeon]|nr:GNAT family N-acetyltransferase [Candidatus Woesearchaeota archaeon]
MITVRQTLPSTSLRISLREQGKEIGHAYLVEEAFRGKGLGKKIVREAIQEAKRQGCYKLICTGRDSKEEVHKFYHGLGFKVQGKEFRMEL